jgi:hypothetical protein
MSIHYQLAKARQDELRRTATRDRLAAQARRARPPRPHRPAATSAWRMAAIRLRRLFA